MARKSPAARTTREGSGGKGAVAKRRPRAASSSALKPDAASQPRDARQGRRAVILDAALDEFAARGFMAARLDDVARRAGIAKGTIYLYFKDKDTLFQELVRAELGPIVGLLRTRGRAQGSVRDVLQSFVSVVVHEIVANRRSAVVRLVMSEGARFPQLADFYYSEVISPAIETVRALIRRGIETGEIRNAALARFPQLVPAPMLLAIVWQGLFARHKPLDVDAMLRAHLDLIFGPAEPPQLQSPPRGRTS